MSTTALKSTINHTTVRDTLSIKDSFRKQFVASNTEFRKYSERVVRLTDGINQPFPRKKLIGLVLFVAVLHVIGISEFIRSLNQPSIHKKEKSEVVIEFIKPVIVPPPVIEPPKPLPPPPQQKQAEPPPKAVPKPAVLKTAPAEQNIAPSDITVKENTEAVKTEAPVIAEPVAPEPPPPVVKEEPITEAVGGVGYLNNPAPDYPEFARKKNLEGTVVLRVRVLANGNPSEVKVKKSSGSGVLDDAAIETIKSSWHYTPAKKGSTAVDSWTTSKVEFRLE